MPNLSASELDMVHAASAPLDKRKRAAFQAACLAALDRYVELGPGVVHRVIREHQQAYWDPPSTHGTPLARKPSSKLIAASAIWAAN
jgi:hypothetical protein